MATISYRKISNLKGDKGDKGPKGDAGTFVGASATSVAADQPAAAIMSGPDSAKSVEFKIPRGLPGVNGLENDAAVATYVRAADSQTFAAIRATVGTYIRDIREFLLPGETLDLTGTTNVSVIVQRAIDALNLDYIATGRKYQLRFPVGRYLLSTRVTRRPGVGLLGESRTGTIFLSGTSNTPFGDPDPTPWAGVYTKSIHDRNFTIDCSAQTAATYDAALKYYICQHFEDMLIEDVTGIGSWASGFGFDFCTGKMRNCVSIGAGRGHREVNTIGKVTAAVTSATVTLTSVAGIVVGSVLDVFDASKEPAWVRRYSALVVTAVAGSTVTFSTAVTVAAGDRIMVAGASNQPAGHGSGAGFGIGVGALEYEPFELENCASYHSGTSGVFTELLDNRPEGLYRPFGFKITGGEFRGNKYGYLNAGSQGAVITGVLFAMNRYAGMCVRTTFQTTYGGGSDKVTGCTFYRNGNAQAVPGSGNTGAGVLIVQGNLGGYHFTACDFIQNYGPGFWVVTNGSALGPDCRFDACTFDSNWQSGILLTTNSEFVERLTVRGSLFRNNGYDATALYRDGITSLVALRRPEIVGNTFIDDRETKAMQYAVNARYSSNLMIQPRIMDNDFTGTATGLSNLEQTIVIDTLVKDNMTGAVLGGNGFFEQDFTSAPSGDWAFTQVGSRVVLTEGSSGVVYTSAIAAGRYSLTVSTTSGRVVKWVDVAAPVYTVRGQIGVAGSTRALTVVLRGTSYNNYVGLTARIDASNFRWAITKRVNGSSTIVQDLGVASNDDDSFEVVCGADGLYTVKINGTAVGTVTVSDSQVIGGRKVGIHASQNPAVTGNWRRLSALAA